MSEIVARKTLSGEHGETYAGESAAGKNAAGVSLHRCHASLVFAAGVAVGRG